MMLTMKALHVMSRNCTGLTNVVFQHQHLAAFLSTSCPLHSRKKKVNGYEGAEQEKYASLVQKITSRTSSQTPERLFEEDHFLYGKVIKSKVSSEGAEPRVPQNHVPLYNANKVTLPSEKTDPGILMKIDLPARGLMANRMPSVTRILQQTMSMEQAFHLERWKQRMIIELGEEGFIEYTAAVFKQGKLFHARLEDLLQSREDNIQRPEDTEESLGYLDSVEHVLADVKGLRTLESAVLHSELKYLGIVDCVAHYRGKLCIIEWKTSEKQKPHIEKTFDNPLQVAAYVGALNHDSNYNFQVDCGLIVVAYKDGSPAHAHFMDPEMCTYYWDKWLLRLEEYKEKKEEKQ